MLLKESEGQREHKTERRENGDVLCREGQLMRGGGVPGSERGHRAACLVAVGAGGVRERAERTRRHSLGAGRARAQRHLHASLLSEPAAWHL